MDWDLHIRHAGRVLTVELNGRFVELETTASRERRVEWGSVASEAETATREACADG